MVTITMTDSPSKSVSAQGPTQKKEIAEILYFPKISSELEDGAENGIQEVWVLEKKRLDKFLVEIEKYDTAAAQLAEAREKLVKAKGLDEMDAAKEEVIAAQDNMRQVLAEGFGEQPDDGPLPLPEFSGKGLVECVGLVNKRTFYISNHDLRKVKDTKGFKDFRIETNTMEAIGRDIYDSMEAALTDADDGTADEKMKTKWLEVKTEIKKKWEFAEASGEGQLRLKRIKRFIPDAVIREFILTDDNCELIDNAIKYFNDTARFAYNQKEQRLAAIKELLEKPDGEFDHQHWGQVLLGVQEIWNKTDSDFVQSIKEDIEEIPLDLDTRQNLVEQLYDHGLPDIVFDASGGAQLMRYTANSGGVADFNFSDGKLGASYSADAKFSLFEAGAECNYYFPHNNGFDMVFDAPIWVECLEKQQVDKGSTWSETDPMYALNSSFLLPSAIVDTGKQLLSLAATKLNRTEQELLIQIAGHTDASGAEGYNERLGKLRARSAQALFIDNTAEWMEFFEKGIWGDEERDLMAVSRYLFKKNPVAFKRKFAGDRIGDGDRLNRVLKRYLRIAVLEHGYPVGDIRNPTLAAELAEETKTQQDRALSQSVSFALGDQKAADRQLISSYMGEMRQMAVQAVPGLQKADMQLFHVDSDVYPLLSYGESMLLIEKEGLLAANRRISLIPWGVELLKEKDITKINLGKARLHIHGQLSGMVGATIGLSAQMEINTYNGAVQLVGKKKKEDKVVQYSDKTPAVDEDGANNATASVGAFVGAKAEAALSAALEWNNPNATSDGFGILASVGGSVTGTAGAGIEGEFKIGFDQDTNTFQIKMKAQATWGIGGGGAVCFSVGIQQLYDFMVLVYEKLKENDFNFTDIFENQFDSANEETESNVDVYKLYIAWVTDLWQQKEYIKAGAAVMVGTSAVTAFGVLQDIDNAMELYKKGKVRKEETLNMIENINKQEANDLLKLVLPETKGRMLYMLSKYGTWTLKEVLKSADPHKNAEEAAVKVVQSVRHAREWQEVMEHMAVRVESGDYLAYTKGHQIDKAKKQKRVRDSMNYLRNGLLNDWEDWERVRQHMVTLNVSETAWGRSRKLTRRGTR